MTKVPTVGISYSWRDNDAVHKAKVKLFAEKLTENEIEVFVDFFGYEPTHDLFYFMEKLVHENDYILFICESSSKMKADNYTGQLGSQEVPHLRPFLSNPKQEKIIPIIFEKDKNGNPIKPRFLELAYGFDLSNDNSFASESFYFLIDFLKGKRNSKPSISNFQNFSNTNHQGLPEIHNLQKRRINSFLAERTKNVVSQIAIYFDKNKHTDYSKIKPLGLISTSGEGKSTAIIEFCYKYGKQFDYIFEIDGGSNIENQIDEIGTEKYLNLFPQKQRLSGSEIKERIEKVISFLNENNTLIVFDDIKSFQEIVDFLPISGRSRVLLSSTNLKLRQSQDIDIVAFPYLEKEDAFNILIPSNYRNKISDSEKEKYYELCDFLNNMPFALEIAKEYIEEYYEMGIEYFLNELKESSLKWEGLLSNDKRGKINKSTSVIALIENKINRVSKNPIIKDLLSFIAASSIAGLDFRYEIFQEVTNLEKKEFIKIKNTLSSEGIVDLGDDKFIVHKLFIEYFILFFCKNEQKIIFGEYLCKACNRSKDLMFQFDSWLIYDKERIGLKLICNNILKSNSKYEADKLISLFSCAWSHFNLEDKNTDALDCIENALTLAENNDNVNPDYFKQRKYALTYQKAITIHKMGNYPLAESLYTQILKKQNFVTKQVIINSVFYCGHIARINKLPENAIIWYEDGINIIKEVLKDFKDDNTKEEANMLMLRGYNYLKSTYDEIGNKEMSKKYEKESANYKSFIQDIGFGVRRFLDYDYTGSLKPSSNLGLRIVLFDKDGNFKFL